MITWFISGFLLAGVLSDSVPLIEMLPSEWRLHFIVFTAIGSGFSLIIMDIWLIYGSNDKRIEALDKAKSTWQIFFYILLFICLALFIAFVIIMVEEQITTVYYFVTFIVILFQTVLLFWLLSFFFSPTNVEYIPYFK
jgi:hypothetical protein